jgi:O-antigen/teichoic acid export membrane protein
LSRFLKTFSANSFGIVVAILGQILSIPLFLHVWNKQLYGEWLVLTAVPNLLWSLEGGLGVLASNRMTLASASKDWAGANEIFQTTLLCQAILCAALYAGAIYLATSTSIATYFGFHIITNGQASDIVLIMMAYMLFGMTISVYRAAYRACDREPRSALMYNVWRFVDLMVVVLVLSFGGNPLLMAYCMFTEIMIWIGLVYFDVRRTCPALHFGFRTISWMRLREMAIHGTPLLIGQATVALYMQGYPLIVNRALGSAPVVTLTTLRTISRFGLFLVQTVSYSCSAQLSRSYGARDWDLFRQLLKVMAAAVVWCSAGMVVTLTIFGPFLISRWTGGRLNVDHLTIFLFALSVSFQGFWICCQITLSSCNRHHLFNYCYFTFTVLGGVAAYFLTRLFGFTAIPAVMLTVDICIAILGLYLIRKKVPESHLRELLCVFQPAYYKHLLASLRRQPNLLRKARG